MLAVLIDDFLQKEWTGTATELCSELKKMDGSFNASPNTIKKQLKSVSDLCRNEFNVAIDFDRNRKDRLIFMKRLQEDEAAEAANNEGVTA